VISSDLSEYVKFHCTGEGKDRTCAVESDSLKFTPSFEASDGSVQEYGVVRTFFCYVDAPYYFTPSCALQGVAMYAAISIAAGILVILLTFLYLLSGIFCCLFGLCVKRQPRKQSMFSKPVRTIGAGVMVLTFFAFLATMVILSYSVGVKEAFSAMTDVVDAPRGVAEITYRFSLATQPAFVGVVSKAMLPALRGVNSTMCSAVSWEGVIGDLKDINASVGMLPNLRHVKHSLMSLDNKVDELNDKLDQITNYNDDYTAKKDDLMAKSVVVQDDLTPLKAALDDVQTGTDALHASTEEMIADWALLYGADGPESYTATDQDGYIDAAQYDIDRSDRDDTPGEGIPTTATLTDAATGATASLATLLDSSLDGDVTQLSDLITKLAGIYASVVQMPDFSATADNLVHINDTINSLIAPTGAATVITTQIDDLEAAVNALPDMAVIKGHVQDMFDAVDTLDASSLTNLLTETNTLIQSVPDDINDILDEINKISGAINSLRAPLRDLMVEQPKRFNATIMEPPTNTTKLYTKVDDVLVQAVDAADDISPTLNDLTSTITDEVDITGFINQISDAQTSYSGAVDRDGMDAALNASAISLTFDAATFRASLNDVDSSLTAARVPMSVVDGFNALETLRSALEVLLRDAVGQIGDVGSDGTTVVATGEYRLLVQGVCAFDGTTYCSADSDCPSGICDHIAEYRCAADGTAFTACTQDSDCAATCLADSDRATSLQSSLLALADLTVSSLGQDDLDARFDDLRAASASADVPTLQTDVEDMQASLADADIDTYQQSISDMQDTLNNDLDFTSYLTSLNDAQGNIDDIDIGSFIDQLDKVIDKQDEYGDKLSDYINFAEDLKDYIFQQHGLGSRLKEMDAENLNAVLESDGFGPVLMSLGQTMEDVAGDFSDMMQQNSLGHENVEITKDMRDPATYMDRFTANPHRGYKSLYDVGALYYMMQLANQTAEMVTDANDPTADTITKNSDGESYPDGKYCVTRDCFANQQDDMETGYGAYLPLLLVPPALIALLALANFGCVFVPVKSGGCCRRCMPHWLICMIIVIVPWYLIFSGFFFAFIMGLSDTCTAGPKIGANYVTAYGDALCDKLGGEGTLANCVIKGNDLDVSVNIRRMVDVTLGQDTCGGSDSEDPFYVPLHALAGQLRETSLSRTHEEVSKKKYHKYRPPLKNIATDLADGSSEVVRDFVDSIGSDVITCDNVQDVLQYFTAPVCYSGVGPLAWIMGTLYLAAWSMCCLGLPAACALKNTFKWEDEELKQQALAEQEGEGAAAEGEAPVAAADGEGAAAAAVAAPGADGTVVDPASVVAVVADVESGTLLGEEDEKAYLRYEGEETFYAPVATHEGYQGLPAEAHAAEPASIITGTQYDYSRAPASEKDLEKMMADGVVYTDDVPEEVVYVPHE
jgi:DNA repair ATPase RecN